MNAIGLRPPIAAMVTGPSAVNHRFRRPVKQQQPVGAPALKGIGNKKLRGGSHLAAGSSSNTLPNKGSASARPESWRLSRTINGRAPIGAQI